MNSSKCLKSFWASWQGSYTLKWEVGRRPDCLIVTWESEEVDKPKSLWGSKEYNFFLRHQEKTMGQIFILYNFIGWFHCIVHCFFHVLPEGEVYCYLWNSIHKSYRGWEHSLWEIKEWYGIQSSMKLSDKHSGGLCTQKTYALRSGICQAICQAD